MFGESWAIHDINRHVQIVISSKMPCLDGDLELVVDDLWFQEQNRLSGKLFNGHVFCAEQIGPDLITGHWTEYRRLVAQLARPELFAHLRVRSLAVNGVVMCPDGVVFGRRPEQAIYQAGLWQLAPAGSVDPSAASPEGTINAIRQAATELREELGIPFDMIDDAEPVALVEHPISHVCDLGICLRTGLRAADILSAHARYGDSEYGVIRIIPQTEILAFAASLGDGMARQSRMLLHRLGWLE